MSEPRFVSIFDQTMGSFRGAADLVMGMEARVRQRRNDELLAAVRMQGMEFDRQLFPLRVMQLREELASERMQQQLNQFRLGQLRLADENERTADAATHAGFARLMQEYSAYRGGGVGQSLGYEAESELGGSGFQPGLDGAFGEDLPVWAPAALDAKAGELLPSMPLDPAIPFAPDDDGPMDASGDGPGKPVSIVERELAARRMKSASIVDRELAARAATPTPGVSTVPRGVILKRQFELMMRAAGGPGGMATRFQQWLPKVSEAMANLEFDPEVAAWQRAQAAAVKGHVDRAAAIGKIASAGLRNEDFADVLGAIEMGLPVDPTILDKRIEAGYKLREEQAKLQAGKATSLNLLIGRPGVGQLASAGIALFARAEKSKAENMQAALFDMLTRGDTAAAQGLLKSVAIDLAPTAIQNEYAAAAQMAGAVADAKASLDAFYAEHGDNATGPVKGRQISDLTGDKNVQALRTRLALSRQAYTKAMTGASFSDQEREQYERMFPSETKTKGTNTAQMEQLNAGLEVRRRNAETAAFGSLAPVLSGAPSAATVPAPAAPGLVSYATQEELTAAAARGEIQPGAVVLFQGQLIRFTGK